MFLAFAGMNVNVLTRQWIGGCVLALAIPVAQASNPMNQEIDALLAFVESSQCRFVRNGAEHEGAQARAHLEKKRDYLVRRGMLQRAEDFIELGASRSSISGKDYEVRCPSSVFPARNWLTTELERIRRQ